jgi:hypothetical protein
MHSLHLRTSHATWWPFSPRRRGQPRQASKLAPSRRLLEQELPDAVEAPPACGWFDSSHDLRAGLEVIEAEAASAALPAALLDAAHARSLVQAIDFEDEGAQCTLAHARPARAGRDVGIAAIGDLPDLAVVQANA